MTCYLVRHEMLTILTEASALSHMVLQKWHRGILHKHKANLDINE
jgi:hypothetical protein